MLKKYFAFLFLIFTIANCYCNTYTVYVKVNPFSCKTCFAYLLQLNRIDESDKIIIVFPEIGKKDIAKIKNDYFPEISHQYKIFSNDSLYKELRTIEAPEVYIYDEDNALILYSKLKEFEKIGSDFLKNHRYDFQLKTITNFNDTITFGPISNLVNLKNGDIHIFDRQYNQMLIYDPTLDTTKSVISGNKLDIKHLYES